METQTRSTPTPRSLHVLGVVCGLAAGAWLGGAEAPTKLVTIGLSPFLISLCMVSGVFVARWTLPVVLKGTTYIFLDLRARAHLMVWAILAGALWAVANTLTVFAIRDVGLSIAFPLWNTNSLVGIFWGWFLFRELRGHAWKTAAKVLGGAGAVVFGATLLGLASAHQAGGTPHRLVAGILSSLGAGLMWGTMYIPYRKAYLSGMNPLSFVTVFTVGELVTTITLALVFLGGVQPVMETLTAARPVLFWLFLGGFCWVVGDLFQQYAAKYIGIGRGIPLSNTNQLWGLAWGVLVFGELASFGKPEQAQVIVGSLIMILGAVAISSAMAPDSERAAVHEVVARECDRYGLNLEVTTSAQFGKDPLGAETAGRRWWDFLIVALATGTFVWLARYAMRPPIIMAGAWIVVLVVLMLAMLVACGCLLWKHTRFS
ncbi:MAG: GRP family sugar transporter [Terriglobia bacterium]